MNSISKTIKRSLAFALSFVMVVSVLTTVPATTTEAAAKKIVKSVAVSKSKTTITAGKSTTLKAKVTATKKVAASDLKVTVKSSKKSIATVKITKNPAKKAKSGYTYFKVTGKKAGKATITVTAKNKSTKGKTVKKSIAVTVKAKTTQAPTTAAPTTEAPTTEDPTVLKGIVVTADPVEINEKGSTKITVAADPATATIKDVKYESKNPLVATVTNDGIVNGVSEGTAEIVVTADGFTKSIVIKVLKSVEGKIVVEPESAKLFIGEEKVLTYKLEGEAIKDMPVSWKSSDEKVATVANDGTVKAIATGNAIITATVGTTSITGICNVEVTGDALAIGEVKATSAKQFTIALTKDIVEADRSKVKVQLFMGKDELTDTAAIEWKDGHTVTVTRKTNYAIGTYTVKISSADITINPAKAEGTAEIVQNKANRIVIDTTPVSTSSTTAVKYTVYDMYDQPYTMSAGDIQWNVTSTNTSVTLPAAITSTFGVVKVDTSALKAGDKLRFNAFVKNDTKVDTGLVEVPVEDLVIDHIEITGIEGVDGKTTEVFESNKAKEYTLVYTATDNFKNAVDISTKTYANINAVEQTLSSTNSNLVSGIAFAKDKAGKYTGKITCTVNPNVNGESEISGMGYDYKKTTYKFVVKPAPKAEKVTFPADNEVDVVAEEVAIIPVKFIDQYEKEIKNVDASGSGTATAFDKLFRVSIYDYNNDGIASKLTGKSNTASDGEEIGGDEEAAAVYKYKNGNLYINTKGAKKAGTLKIVVNSATTDKYPATYLLNVKEGRTPSQVVLADAKASVLQGGSMTVNFTVKDKYDTAINPSTVKVRVSTDSTNIAVSGGVRVNGTSSMIITPSAEQETLGQATFKIDGVNVTTADQTYTVDLVKEKGTKTCWDTYKVTLLNVANSTTEVVYMTPTAYASYNDPAKTIVDATIIRIYSAPTASSEGGADKYGSSTETVYEVIDSQDYKLSVNTELASVEVSSKVKEVTAGTTVNFTVTAKDSDGNKITNYNEKIRVLAVEDHTTAADDRKDVKVLEFVNGEATMSMVIEKVEDNTTITLYTIAGEANKITKPSDNSKADVTAYILKVTNGACAKIKASATSATAIILTAVDAYDNVVKNYAGGEVVVKVERKNASNAMDDKTKNIFGTTIDKNNKVIAPITFNKDLGTAQLTGLTGLTDGDVVTITIGGVTTSSTIAID